MKNSAAPGAILSISIAAAMLAACGYSGSGGSGTTTSSSNQTGTASGTVQGFGSIFVNGREFDTSSASFVIDDQPGGTELDLAVGNAVEIKATFQEDGSAIASEVRFDAELEGEIATLDLINNSFTVAGQTVFVSGTTFFEGASGFADLRVGNVVEVSGNIDANGDLLASSVEVQQNPANEVEVKGTVENHDSANRSFVINALTVAYSGAVLDPVDLQVDDGQFVEVSGTLAGETLTAGKLELEDRVPIAAGDVALIEGIVGTVDSASTFTLVSGVQVAHDSDTVFEGGTAADIQPGARIEVEGEVDGNGVLQAVTIELENGEDDPAVEVTAQVDTVDTSSDTLTLLGVVDVQATDDTRIKDDRDGVRAGFTVDAIQQGDYVEIAAIIEGDSLFATRIERGEPETNDTGVVEVKLQGPLASEDTTNGTIIISGVTVDFGEDTEFEDAQETPITMEVFFDLAETADVAKVGGTFDGNLINAREVSLE
ncbi:MAG: DUF5666 domain-containing protein [Nitrococcus sp.]|nr:DUF5666 domain-containing protein [Nitrococcus sp.]